MHETSARLLRLLSLLQARRFWSGAELAEALEVTPRTVRRDVERLRSLNYPVQSSAGVAGGYQLGAGASLPPLLLEDDEALAVSLGLGMAAAGAVLGLEEAALRASAKLEQVLPKRLRHRMTELQTTVAPLYSAGPRVDHQVLIVLASACRDRERVRFRYGDGQGNSTDRDAEPHGLVHTGSRWYLLAWDLVRNDWRTFRIDRIAGEVSRGPSFEPREVPGGDVAGYVSRSVASRPYPFRARVIFHAPRERVAERVPPLVGYLERVDADRCLLESGAHSLGMLALHIGLVGEEFEVEEPAELVDLVRALAGRLTRAVERTTPDEAVHSEGSAGPAIR